MVTILLLVNVAYAENETGFQYSTYDAAANTIRITGYTGTLKPGQDLTVPSEINGRTVVAIEGYYGTVGAGLGTFTLPDTIKSIRNLHVNGFTGTLTIPASVTYIEKIDGLYFTDIEELVLNATVDTFEQGAWEFSNNHVNPLKKIVIGDNIKIFSHPFLTTSDFPYLERVEVSDNVQRITLSRSSNATSSKCNAIFYLKKFPVTDSNGVTTDARGLAIGLKDCKYYYTNVSGDVPVEQIFITKKIGFTNIRDDDPNSSYGQSSPGLYAGWSGTIQVCTSPINATNTESVEWISTNPSVATVADGVVTAIDIGSTTIRATLNDMTVEFAIRVGGILVVSNDDGVSADNLAGNMQLPDEGIDWELGVSLELEVDQLNPQDWQHWGQLKKILEDAYNKSLDCSDLFDIKVNLKNGTSVWKVQPIDGKKISIWMPIEDAEDISKRHLVHVKDDSSYEEIDFTYEPIDGVHGIRFETTSFSSFALLAESGSMSNPDNGGSNPGINPNNPAEGVGTRPEQPGVGSTDTTDSNWWIIVVLIVLGLAVVGAAAFVYIKKAKKSK
jgi:hypothetical protein